MAQGGLTMDVIATRLEVVEEQHRRTLRELTRLKRVTVSCLGLAGAALLIAAGPQGRVLKAHQVEAARFVVRDAQGKQRGALGLHDNEVQLALSGADEKPRAMLTIDAGAPILGLFDGSGKQRLGLAVAPDGQPRFGLYDQSERQRIAFALLGDGAPVLRLYDGSEKLRVALGATTLEKAILSAKERTAESSLLLLDGKEQVLFQAP